jgi:hypothetical protein
MTAQALSYAIDEHDHLIRVDEGYYRFAEENGWPDAGSSLGRSLWDYVAGRELVNLQRLLVRRVRDEVGDVELPFRCDAPDVRRDLPQRLLDPATPRSDEMLEMCSWCDRFEVDGEWVEVEEAARRLELFNRPELPALSHGVCPDCNEMLLAA